MGDRLETMPTNQIADFETGFSNKYLSGNVFDYYPETRIIPKYLHDTFEDAEIALDLGFGGGLWFWASFLPSLQRLDGFDLHPEALAAVNDIFERQEVPPGFLKAHGQMGEEYSYDSLMNLQRKAGEFVFQDYRDDWPENILIHEYDLVTEHGGGFGEMDLDSDIPKMLAKISNVLVMYGNFFFMNFNTIPEEDKIAHLMENAGMKLMDFNVATHRKTPLSVDRFFYGYARKM